MAKWQNDLMLDAALQYVIDNSTNIVLCSNQPASFTEASNTITNGGVAIATSSITSGDYAGIVDGVGGRKIVVPQQTDVTVDETATATHVAIISGTDLIYVTTCVSQSVTAGNLVTIPEWEIELRDAV